MINSSRCSMEFSSTIAFLSESNKSTSRLCLVWLPSNSQILMPSKVQPTNASRLSSSWIKITSLNTGTVISATRSKRMMCILTNLKTRNRSVRSVPKSRKNMRDWRMKKKRMNFVKMNWFPGSMWVISNQGSSTFQVSSKTSLNCSWSSISAKNHSTTWPRPWSKIDSLFIGTVSKN